MNIVAAIRMVPDLVEELTVGESGVALDTTWLRLIINEPDDHALEQAILLKERSGGQVTVVAPHAEGIDEILYTAAARGADRVVKLSGDFETGTGNHALARALATTVREIRPDLILTGVQAHNDLDGSLGPLLAGFLGMPYVGYVAGVTVSGATATVRKEYPGGLIAEMEVVLPAVLGIQAAEQPPRYVAVSRIRQMKKTVTIDDQMAGATVANGGPAIDRMYAPEVGERAAMIEGDEEEVAARLVEIFRELGVL